MKRKIDRDALNCARLEGGKFYSFTIREDGVVLKTRRRDLKETRAKVIITDGRAWVHIGHTKYKVDTLVAKHFISGYKPYSVIEHMDGNPKNCARWNLRILPRGEYNKRQSRNGLSKPVVADGTIYPSMTTCANALYVDRNTLRNYLNGKYKNTMLDGMDIHLMPPSAENGKD